MLKKCLLMLLILGSLSCLHAQTPQSSENSTTFYEKGEWLVGISPWIAFQSRIRLPNSDLTVGGTQFSGRIIGGRFVRNKLMIGTGLTFDWSPFVDLITSSRKADLFSRYYFRQKAFSPFIEGNVGYYEDRYYGMDFTPILDGGLHLGGKLGLAYRLGRIGFEGSWGYDWRPGQTGTRLPLTQPGFLLGINFHF